MAVIPNNTPAPQESITSQVAAIKTAVTAQLELVKDLQNQYKALSDRLISLEKKVG